MGTFNEMAERLMDKLGTLADSNTNTLAHTTFISTAASNNKQNLLGNCWMFIGNRLV